MSLNNLILFAINALGISFLSVCLYDRFYKKPERKENSIILLFKKNNANCRKICFLKHVACSDECSLLKLQTILHAIDSAKKTLDVCMFLLTLNSLAYAIINAHKRGVTVRVIIDEEMSRLTDSKISWFLDNKIPVKANMSDNLTNMHNKFCIVDGGTENGKLITGSLNWTMQGIAGNFEYVVIISHDSPVKEYKVIFDDLWSRFEDKLCIV